MDENTAAALSVICSAFRASFVPPALDIDWTDTERANRGFVAFGLAGDNSLHRGAQRILEHLDALCRVCATEQIATLTKNPMYEDLAPRTLGLVTPQGEADIVAHLQWLVAVINGRAGDIASLWRDRDPHEAFESLSRLYKASVPAYVLLREAVGVRSHANPSADAVFMATRLGLVSWTEAVLDERGAHDALRRVLDEFGDEQAWEAAEWFSAICCNVVMQRCVSCPVNMDCHALALGV